MNTAVHFSHPERDSWGLSQWLSWQESLHPKAWDLGLARISEVWRRLNCGVIAERVLIVAGTNGKGSCVRWAEALAMAHGVAVATFTSPHLQDYRERIRFAGQMVDEAALCAAFRAIDAARGEISLTYFEWSALAAFYLMAAQPLQLAVLEVGLGGRLDATNIIDADAAIITRIGLDHQDWLGETIEAIAGEKAGVLRREQIVALPVATPPAPILAAADELALDPWWLGKQLNLSIEETHWTLSAPNIDLRLPLPTLLPGAHQCGHLAAVLAVLAQWFRLDAEIVAKVVRETALTGRLTRQTRAAAADILFDVAHNADSAEILAAYLQSQRGQYRCIHMICGMLRDKDHHAVFTRLAPVVDTWALCTLHGPRATPMPQFYASALAAGIDAHAIAQYGDCRSAEIGVDAQADAHDLIVVMGSFITVGELLHEWEGQ